MSDSAPELDSVAAVELPRSGERRESDRLLTLAESQQERVQRLEQRLPIRYVLLILSVLVNLAGMYSIVKVRSPVGELSSYNQFHPFYFNGSAIYVVIVAMSFAFAVATFDFISIRGIHAQLGIERRALRAVMALVHENLASLRSKEAWSLIEQAEVNIRLSRLPIGAEPPELSGGSEESLLGAIKVLSRPPSVHEFLASRLPSRRKIVTSFSSGFPDGGSLTFIATLDPLGSVEIRGGRTGDVVVTNLFWSPSNNEIVMGTGDWSFPVTSDEATRQGFLSQATNALRKEIGLPPFPMERRFLRKS